MVTAISVRSKDTIYRNVYKGCRRCGGDLVLDREAEADSRGFIDNLCLQCGRHTSIHAIMRRFQAQPARPAA